MMKNYDDIEMKKEDGDIVFTAVKTSLTRNLEGEEVEQKTEQEVARMPNNKEVCREIANQLIGKFYQAPMEGKSVTQKMDEAYDRWRWKENP